MKLNAYGMSADKVGSLPSRGARVEIDMFGSGEAGTAVAPLAGSEG